MNANEGRKLWPRPAGEIELSASRSGGPGGQNVNKVATAIQLRFDIAASALPEEVKRRLLGRGDRRVSDAGVLVLHASEHRSQEMNRNAALARLRQLIESAGTPRKARKATRPSRAARERRLQQKARRSRVKQMRGRVEDT